MTNLFNSLRVQNEISCTEFADWCGMSRQYAAKLETGREPMTAGLLRCLRAMIEERK